MPRESLFRRGSVVASSNWTPRQAEEEGEEPEEREQREEVTKAHSIIISLLDDGSTSQQHVENFIFDCIRYCSFKGNEL